MMNGFEGASKFIDLRKIQMETNFALNAFKCCQIFDFRIILSMEEYTFFAINQIDLFIFNPLRATKYYFIGRILT